MALSGIITLPLLKGTVQNSSLGQVLLARRDKRIYPYQLGAMVRSTSNGTTVNTHGLGEFEANDYLMVCSEREYGESPLFVPDTTRIEKVTAVSGSDDQLTVANALSVVAGEYLLNLGADGATDPTSAPDYDGSTITLYTDNVGNNANSNKYLVSGQGGFFHGWTQTGIIAVDLLITNESGSPEIVKPFHTLGAEVV